MIWLFVPFGIALLYWLFMSPWAQVLGRFPYRARTDKKLVALTFDDGPNEPFTSELLAYLKKEAVPATFFVVGTCLERHPLVAQKIIKQGHTIGNHSLTHRFGTYLQPGKFIAEIKSCQDIIYRQTGKKPALFRPPWLWRQPLLLRATTALGLSAIGGEFCHSREVFHASASTISRGAIAKIKPGAILIFHDGKEGTGGDRSNTIEAVKQTVDVLKRRGYSFVTVDTLLGLEPYLN